MAFQTPAVASFSELWPSVRTTLTAPFRTRPSPSTRLRAQAVRDAAPVQSTPLSASPTPSALPDFMRHVRLPALASRISTVAAAPMDIRTSISSMQRVALLASNPVVHRLYPHHLLRRSMSTAPSASAAFRFRLVQTRSFQSSGLSRNLLARMEEAANRNPTSATAQNAFYQALLRANMPAIVIERYQSNRFATNAATTDAYNKAMNLLAPPAAHSDQAIDDTVKNLPGTLTPTQIQAVSQALAARSRGANIAVAKDPAGVAAKGTKDGPLHVVVDESVGSAVFRWIKFLLYFALATYLCLVVVTLAIESMSMFRRPGSKAVDSEVKPEQQKARFSDVHGADEAKEELQDMVEFLRNPDKFSQLGGKLPKGILLVGPPGTGKTLLARAVAGEAGVPFFYMSGSEFDEVYVGVGAKRVRDLFAAAKAKSPAIVFIDELDAIGGRRNARDASYVKQTLNQLLTELDGFDQSTNVIIIGATNFPDSLDKALTRPGRFDRHVQVDLPDVRGRLAILQHHAKKIRAEKDVDLKAIAQTTSGLSGAELENIVNQAAVHASKNKSKFVGKWDFDWAKDKVIMGAERKSMVITPKEKEMTAYHEAGHALMQILTQSYPGTLYKVTVLPRGPSLGHTAYLPEMDKFSYTVANYRATIDVCLGGKLAEEIVYGSDQVTSGASSDLQQATRSAFSMVASFGMSQKLGNMEYSSRYDKLSSETKAIVESEVQRTLDEAYERSRVLLTKHRKELDLLAKALVDYETLSKEEVEKVIRGETLPNRLIMPKGPMVVPANASAPSPTDPEPSVPGASPPPPPVAPPPDTASGRE